MDKIQAAQELSSRRFHIGMQKADAWNKAQRLATYLEGRLHLVEYLGPVAIAGGCLRDLALNRVPKDLDIFLDGGAVRNMAHGHVIAGSIAEGLGHGAYVHKTLKSYGTWAADLDYVVKIAFPEEQTEGLANLDMSGIPVPFEVDVIVLGRDRLVEMGYRPAMHLTSGVRASFLRTVLERVDLRLNAIGACSTSTDAAAQWDDDALNERLVVQHARVGEDLPRIDARLRRLSDPEQGKYAGWKVMFEGPDGQVHPSASQAGTEPAGDVIRL